VAESEPAPRRRRVRRGEGEVTQWPRGLVDYVPAGPDDAPPSPEEDRIANRLALAARLLATLRARGEAVEREIGWLSEARRHLAAGERAAAAQQVDALLGALGAASAGARRERA